MLGMERVGNVIRIAPAEKLRNEMQEMMKKELSSSKTTMFIAVAVVIIGAAAPFILQFLQGGGK